MNDESDTQETPKAAKERGDKEVIYDECISPLMDKIIAAAEAHGIPMVASFQLGDTLHCTTMLFVENMGPFLYGLAETVQAGLGDPVGQPREWEGGSA